MKKTLFYSFISLAVLAGCADKSAEAGTTGKDSTATRAATVETKSPEKVDGSTEVGCYVGEFVAEKFQKGKNPSYSNRINISVDQLRDYKIEGHSVVAGNSRTFSGTYDIQEDGSYTVEAAEPGDDKYDGKFSFVLDPSSRTIRGTWVANDAKLAVTERSYDLIYKTFKYDPDAELPEEVGWADLYSAVPDPEWQRAEITTDEVTKYNASKVKLKAEDVENMYKSDMEILRNSIYARHGYSFKTRKMRYVFDTYVDWYIPMSTDVSKELTQLEQENIALLKRYEQHAETYYDTFGR
ncbi:MAG TPA: YARHG domain-containing protein [Bacteroidia bacterium]|nr:YARHG domain-containing protein [Bacteroidia bacterium]